MSLFLIGTLSPHILNANAEYPGPRIYIDPTPIYFDATNGTVGTRFNVTVWIENVTEADPGLDGWQVELHYDDSIINVTSDANGLRAWPSATRGANKYNTSYVFYNFTAVASTILKPTYTHVDPNDGNVLVADATIGTEDFFMGDRGLLAIIEFQITSIPETGLVGTLDITNDYTWVKPDELQNKATFQDGQIIPEFSPSMLIAMLLSLTLVAIVLRKEIIGRKG